MKKQIPHIEFNPSLKEHFGFELVPMSKISKNKNEYKHNPEKPHQLSFYNLIFFTSGEGRHYIDFNWYPVQKNSLVYLTKKQVNAFELSGNLDGFCLIFNEEFFVECFSKLHDSFVFRLFNPQVFSPILQVPEDSDFLTYFQLLKKEYHKEDILNQRIILDSLFKILISKVETLKNNQTHLIQDTSKTELFHKFTSLLEKEIYSSRSAEHYASQLTISYKHLNEVCKELVHKTAKNVIDDYLILMAKRALINCDIKSVELAYHLGFDDPTNFTKYFKKHTGITPKAFKNQ